MISGEPIDRLRVTVSREPAEIDAVMRVSHDAYVAAGYMRPSVSGRRFLVHYLNPDTIFVVARVGGIPVGTLAIISDGPFGLPADRVFVEELDVERDAGRQVAEVCGLVVAPKWRRHVRPIFFHLAAAMLRTLSSRLDTHTMAFAVEPHQLRFYSSIFGGGGAAERPLYGAPASLILSDYWSCVDVLREGRTSTARRMAELVFEPSPTWLRTEDLDGPWDGAWAAAYLHETGVLARMADQLAALDAVNGFAPARTHGRLRSELTMRAS
jgi:hypothetical protein